MWITRGAANQRSDLLSEGWKERRTTQTMLWSILQYGVTGQSVCFAPKPDSLAVPIAKGDLTVCERGLEILECISVPRPHYKKTLGHAEQCSHTVHVINQ